MKSINFKKHVKYFSSSFVKLLKHIWYFFTYRDYFSSESAALHNQDIGNKLKYKRLLNDLQTITLVLQMITKTFAKTMNGEEGQKIFAPQEQKQAQEIAEMTNQFLENIEKQMKKVWI